MASGGVADLPSADDGKRFEALASRWTLHVLVLSTWEKLGEVQEGVAKLLLLDSSSADDGKRLEALASRWTLFE